MTFWETVVNTQYRPIHTYTVNVHFILVQNLHSI